MGDFGWGLILGLIIGLILFHSPTRNRIINYIKNRQQPVKKSTTKKKKNDNEIR